MAITSLELPNEFNYARQTIPFLVKSDLIGPQGTTGIDPIERSFRFVFDVIAQLSDGQYKTYASISIPPRPDNFFCFFDASPLIIDALSFDLGTHQKTFASPCPGSIVKFKVFCTERYLDSNGNFTSGTKTSLGEYYGIDGGGNEGIAPYLVDSLTVKSPLHHHQLCNPEELKVNAKEPLTLSWLSKNDLGVNELEYIHGNYGTFSDAITIAQPGGQINSISNVLQPYTGITKNALSTVFAQVGWTSSGVCIYNRMTGVTTGGNTNIMAFKFTNLDLSASTTYRFNIQAAYIFGTNPPSSPNYTIQTVVTGTNFSVVSNTPLVMSALNNVFKNISVTFATNSSFTTGDITGIEIRYVSTSAGSPLSVMNNVIIHYDSASLFEVSTSGVPFVSTFEIVTDDSTVHVLPTGYTQNLLPLNDTSQSRFDTPIGPYKIYSGSAQDATTGYWKKAGGVIANWFFLRIKNSAGNVIGQSAKIYQINDTCEKCEKFRLKWKNQLGGWDYFTFTKVSKAKTGIERENFKRSRGFISPTGYKELTTDRGYKSLNIKLQDTYTIISDWVGDGTAKWLQDLFISDEVYLLNPEPFMKYPTTNEFDLEYPVFVQQTEVEFMNNSIEAKLKNFVIEITPAIRFEENSTN